MLFGDRPGFLVVFVLSNAMDESINKLREEKKAGAAMHACML
jgi:hypothetical protein